MTVRSRASCAGGRTAGGQHGAAEHGRGRRVSAEKWQQDRDELLKAEKEATRTLDALAARRRRLPMVKFDNNRYVFDTHQIRIRP